MLNECDTNDDICKVCKVSEYETSIIEDKQGNLVCNDCLYDQMGDDLSGLAMFMENN